MEYIDLKAYLTRLMKNWVVVALCSVIGVLVAFIYSEFLATPVYSSAVKIGVFNSDWSTDVSASDIDTTLKLIKNCMVVLEDDLMAEAIIAEVKEQTGEEYTVRQIKSAVSYSQIGDSQWIRVQSKTTDPELSALLCNALIARSQEILVNSVANIQIRDLGDAKVNYSPVSPNTTKNVIIGFLIGFVGACGVIFLFVFFDNTISSEEIVKEKYDLAVLGVVPYVGVATKTKTKNKRRKKKPRLIV